MPRSKSRKPNIPPMKNGVKSMKMDAGELTDMVKACVKEALAEENGESKEDTEDTVGGETGAVEDIVEQVVDVINEKRKSRKSEGEAVDELSEDEAAEIAEAVEAAIEMVNATDESKGDDSEDEQKENTYEEDTKEEDSEEDQKHKSRPTSYRQTKRRTNSAPMERKYSNIFLMGGTQLETKKQSISPMVQLGRAVKCYDVYGRHDPEAAARYARKYYNDTDMEREFKALATNSPSAGGFLIPETYINQIIELLYSKTVIFELGAQKIPMANGSVNIPKMTSGTRARWGGEQRKIKTTQPIFGNLKLFSKRLEAIVPQSRELLMSTTYSADQLFANDLTRRMELGLDYGGLYGSGNEYQPLGVVNNADIQKIDVSKISDTAIVDGGMVTADFPVYVRAQVMVKNVDDQNLGWTFNSLIEGYLMNLKTSTGAYIYRDEMQGGKLLGSPYKVSNQIPLTAKGTDIIFGNWSDLIVGDQMGLETYTTLDGSWTDEDGSQHNAFEENLTATRALMYVDIGVRHAESFLVARNVMVPGITEALKEMEKGAGK